MTDLVIIGGGPAGMGAAVAVSGTSSSWSGTNTWAASCSNASTTASGFTASARN